MTAGAAPRTVRTRLEDRMRRIQRIHLVGIGGSGMGGDRKSTRLNSSHRP